MWLSQMLERMEKQQHDMHSGLLEQRQQLQAQEEDLATWKADAQRQLDIQQVCTCFIMLQIEIQWRHTQLARHVLTACYCIAACGQLHA